MTYRNTGLKIYFTTYGHVVAGWEMPEWDYDDYKVVIVGTKLKEYRMLSQREKTKEKIKEYGWMLRKDLIVKEFEDHEIPEPPPVNSGQLWNGQTNRSIMFIVGAGASANCVFSSDRNKFKNDKLKPPLGNELFTERFSDFYKGYPGVRESLYYLQQENSDVEKMLENDWADIFETGDRSIMRRHINIQYYLQHVLSRVSEHVEAQYDSMNLYAQLCDRLKRIYARSPLGKKYCFSFVSFNQDTILEFFIEKYFLKRLNSLDSYIGVNENPFCLFKPHGSWNWGWKFPVHATHNFSRGPAAWLYENNTSFYELYFDLLGNYTDMVDWRSWGVEHEINKHMIGSYSINKNKIVMHDFNSFNIHYPAILLPYRDKDEFTMPPAHYQTLDFTLRYVETLVIIGWKGNEAAFLRKLEHCHTIKKVIIVDIYPDLVRENLKDVLSKRNVETIIYNEGFESFVMKGIEKELG